MKAAVFVLSGPWQAFRRNGQFDVSTNINPIRFAHGAKLAIREGRLLVVSVTKAEVERYKEMVGLVLAELGCPDYPVHYLTGANHSLANAWYVLRFASQQDIEHATVCTSNWHMPRVQYLFQTMARILADAGMSVPSVWFRPAPFSQHQAVRRFERRIMRDWQEKLKVPQERKNLEAYAEAIQGIGFRRGEFPPEPSEDVTKFVADSTAGTIYNSIVEPGNVAIP